MAQPPDRINPSDVRWSSKRGAEQEQTQVQTESGQLNIAEKRATLPTAGPKAKADLAAAEARAEQERINLERSKQGIPLSVDERKELGAFVEQFQRLEGQVDTFKPDYAGTILDFPSKIESAVQKRFPGFGTEGQARWWQDMEKLDLIERNHYFGASLTPGEKESWARTTITPGMHPDIVRDNLAARRRIINDALYRTRNTLIAGGARVAQVDATFGKYVSRFTEEGQATFEKQEAARIEAARKQAGEKKTIGLGEAPPEGAQIAGEKIKGFRLSPESEGEITSYVRSPEATPEGLARIITDKAVAEGHATPEQADGMYEANLASATDYLGKFKRPEERAQIPAGVDYSQIDKSAQEQAGVGETALQAARNLPESAVQLAQGTGAVIADPALSAITGERQGIVKTLPDLAADITGLGSGDTLDATMKMLNERYGGGQELKNTLTTDPLGSLADVSMLLSGGGTAAARLPGVAGRAGELARTAARYADPITGAVEAGRRINFDFVPRSVRDLPSAVVANPSGLHGPALREAIGAGFEQGRAGAPTARSEAFTSNMRDPQANATSAVETARNAIGNMRQQAGNLYRQRMAQFGSNPTPLDIDVVRNRMAAIRPDSYDAWVGHANRPSDHLAWERMNDAVEHYATQAQQNPALLEPLAMDAFKQDLYDIGSRTGGAYDRDAARIARTAYNGVREELVRHDPIYADTMRDYERAAREGQQLEETFGLAAARGKQVNVDKASRRLLSIMRNNAYTNYGQRAGLGERLAALDRTGTLMPTLAGQTASAWMPRGISVMGGGTGAMTLNNIASAADLPSALAAGVSAVPMLPLFSPRLMGEAGYWGGRGAGAAARLGNRALDFGPRQLLDLQQRYPATALTGAQLGSRAQEAQLFEDQGEPPPPISLDLNEVPRRPTSTVIDAQTEAPGPIVPKLGPGDHIDPDTDEIVRADGTREPLYAMGGRVERYHRPLMRMAQRYAGGGGVRPSWRDYGSSVMSSLRQAPGGSVDLVGMIPEAAEAVTGYVRGHTPGEVWNDAKGAAQQYGRYWKEHPIGATADLIPFVGDAKMYYEMMDEAARARAAGDFETAKLIERYAVPSVGVGLVPDVGIAASRGIRKAVRAIPRRVPVPVPTPGYAVGGRVY